MQHLYSRPKLHVSGREVVPDLAWDTACNRPRSQAIRAFAANDLTDLEMTWLSRRGLEDIPQSTSTSSIYSTYRI